MLWVHLWMAKCRKPFWVTLTMTSILVFRIIMSGTFLLYEGQSKTTEPFFITFESSKMDIYFDDISLQLYLIYLIT